MGEAISFIIIIIMVIISLFKADFAIIFHNYKKSINVNLPMKPGANTAWKVSKYGVFSGKS